MRWGYCKWRSYSKQRLCPKKLHYCTIVSFLTEHTIFSNHRLIVNYSPKWRRKANAVTSLPVANQSARKTIFSNVVYNYIQTLNKLQTVIQDRHYFSLFLLWYLVHPEHLNCIGKRGWRSVESTRPSPMLPGFGSQTCCRHMWVEFVVGPRSCSEGFFFGSSSFSSLSQKPTFPNSNSIWNPRATCLSLLKNCSVSPSSNKVDLLIYLFVYHHWIERVCWKK